jgi:transaldolase
MKKNPLERLMDTNPELEIWWDSSPLIYPDWAEGFLKKTPPDRVGELREQLRKLFDPEHPEESLFRGVTTNPPLSLAVIKNRESYVAQLVDELIEKDPCIDKEALFWKTYKEIVRRGAEMYLGVFQRSKFRYGYLSGQVDPRAVTDRDRMIAQALELAKLSPNVMIKIPGSKQGYEVIKFLTQKDFEQYAYLYPSPTDGLRQGRQRGDRDC